MEKKTKDQSDMQESKEPTGLSSLSMLINRINFEFFHWVFLEVREPSEQGLIKEEEEKETAEIELEE